MDALTFLREDHKSVLGMLQVLDGAPTHSGAERSGLATMVTNLVITESQHKAVEEEYFWPVVRDALEDGAELADEAIAQQQAGKKLLQRLADGKPGEVDYHHALQEYVIVGREHILFEQDVVWPVFEAAVSREERENIGEKLELARKVARTTPAHVPDLASGRASEISPEPQQH
jgi:hemerythrin-like domain-containing protein